MSHSKRRSETIDLAKRYHEWLASGGKFDQCPKELIEAERRGVLAFLLVSVLHAVLLIGFRFCIKIHLWCAVKVLARIRIKTDKYAICPKACGLNHAYTNLGYAEFKSGNFDKSINLLKASSLVHPCPHNTSFGLSKKLVKAIEVDQSSNEAIREYLEIDEHLSGA